MIMQIMTKLQSTHVVLDGKLFLQIKFFKYTYLNYSHVF